MTKKNAVPLQEALAKARAAMNEAKSELEQKNAGQAAQKQTEAAQMA